MLLDGGLSNALEARGHRLTDRLWTARLLHDAPGEIAAVHEQYFRAGAQVATTASYQASVPGFVAAGLDKATAERLLRSSIAIARAVRDSLAQDGVRRWVAASVGPYGATRADGSEYRGRYDISRTALRDFHAARLDVLAQAEPDLIAVETIPDVAEAEVLAELLQDLHLPAWFSYSASDSQTRAGQPLEEAFAVAAAVDSVIAVGVNCCQPAEVADAVRLARQVSARPVVAYPNSGETWDAASRSWRGAPGFDLALVPGWVADGARLVGGCCRVTPRMIAELACRQPAIPYQRTEEPEPVRHRWSGGSRSVAPSSAR